MKINYYSYKKIQVFICFIILFFVAFIAPASSLSTGDPSGENTDRSNSRASYEWPKPFGSLKNDGYAISYGPLDNKTLWTFEAGDEVYSSPVIADGRLFIGSWDKNLYAFDAEKGTKLWEFNTGDSLYSSPSYSDGLVYIGTGTEIDSNVRKVFAVNAVTGTLEWSHQFGGNVFGTPVIYNDVAYVGCGDGFLYALDSKGNGDQTTTVLWKFKTGAAIWSSPAIEGDKLYFTSTDCKLYKINITSHQEVWNFSADYQFDGLFSSPSLDDSGRVFFGSSAQPNGRFYALDKNTGKELWNISTGTSNYGVSTTGAIHDGLIFAGSNNGKMYALNAETGQEEWTYTTGNNVDGIYSSAVVANNRVYFGSCDGSMYCLTEKEGNLVWSIQTVGSIYGIVSSPAVYNGRVYFGSTDGKIYAIGSKRTGEIQINAIADETLLEPGNSTLLSVNTFNGSLPLSFVQIKLSVTSGSFKKVESRDDTRAQSRVSILIGYTDLSGYYRCNYIAPQVDTYTEVAVDIEASGEGLITNTSSLKIIVNPAKQMELTMTPTKSSYFIGEPITIELNVTGDDKPMSAAVVNYSINYDETGYSHYGITNNKGLYELVYITPSVTTPTVITITATATKPGYLPVENFITVTAIPLTAFDFDVSITVKDTKVLTGKQTSITIKVLNASDSQPVPGADLLFSISGGSLDNYDGKTGNDGSFSLTFTAPTGLTETSTIEFKTKASKTNFNDMTRSQNITVVASESDLDKKEEDGESGEKFFSSPGFYIATALVIVVIIIAVIILIQAKRKRTSIEKSAREERVEEKMPAEKKDEKN